MDCKRYKDMDPMHPDYLEHLKACDDCLQKALEEDALDLELRTMFSPVKPPVYVSQRIDKLVHPLKKYNRILIASLVIMVMISFNPILITLAEKFPIIDDVLGYFQRSERVERAIEDGLEVNEYYFENDEYELYIKDLYVSASEIEFQYCLLTKDHQVPENTSLNFWVPQVDKSSYSQPTIGHVPWQSFSLPFSDAITSDELVVDIRAMMGEKSIFFHALKVDTSHLKKFESKSITVDQHFDLTYCDLYIESMFIGPRSIQVKYNYDNKDDYLVDHLSFQIELDGKPCYVYTSTSQGGSNATTALFEKSPNDSFETIELVVNDLWVQRVEKVGVIDYGKLSFNYNGHDYLIRKGDYNGYATIEILADEVIPLVEFPDIAFKRHGAWQGPVIVYFENKYIQLTKKDIENCYGILDAYEDEDPQKLIDYVNQNYEVTLDLDYLKRVMIHLTSVEHFKTDEVVMSNKESMGTGKQVYSIEDLPVGVIGDVEYMSINFRQKIEE